MPSVKLAAIAAAAALAACNAVNVDPGDSSVTLKRAPAPAATSASPPASAETAPPQP